MQVPSFFLVTLSYKKGFEIEIILALTGTIAAFCFLSRSFGISQIEIIDQHPQEKIQRGLFSKSGFSLSAERYYFMH